MLNFLALLSILIIGNHTYTADIENEKELPQIDICPTSNPFSPRFINYSTQPLPHALWWGCLGYAPSKRYSSIEKSSCLHLLCSVDDPLNKNITTHELIPIEPFLNENEEPKTEYDRVTLLAHVGEGKVEPREFKLGSGFQDFPFFYKDHLLQKTKQKQKI